MVKKIKKLNDNELNVSGGFNIICGVGALIGALVGPSYNQTKKAAKKQNQTPEDFYDTEVKGRTEKLKKKKLDEIKLYW